MSKVLVTKEKLDTVASIVCGKSNTPVPETIDDVIEAADKIETPKKQSKKAKPRTNKQVITYDPPYNGLEDVTILPIEPIRTYGSVYRSNNSVFIPYGWYPSEVQYNVPTMTLPTSTTTTKPSGTTKATISRSTSTRYLVIPTGYNSSSAYYTISSVENGTAGTPTATKGTVSNHSVSVTPSVTNTTGYITGSTKTGTAVNVSASELVSGTKSITDNGTGIDVTNYEKVDVSVSGGSPNLQDKTGITPTESSQTIEADTGYDGLSSVQIDAISSSYVGSGITRRSSTDLSASGATVSVPSGYYSSEATKSVSSGTEGTPTATKGTVSNHSVSITPSVTNTAGYISGGTKTGTAVSVSASELVSGNKEITENGTNIDVTNYSTVSVNVESGGGGITQDENGYIVLPPTGGGSSGGNWAWYGMNAELLQTGTGTVALKDTDYPSWTPSTTSAIIARVGTQDIARDSEYQYVCVFKYVFNAVYQGGEVPISAIKKYWSVFCLMSQSFPQDITQWSSGDTFTGGTSKTLSMMGGIYKNSSGNDQSVHDGYYAVYAQAMFNTNTSSTINAGLTIRAACSTQYFTTSAAALIDQEESKYTYKYDIYKVPKASSVTQSLLSTTVDLFRNGIS